MFFARENNAKYEINLRVRFAHVHNDVITAAMTSYFDCTVI